MSTAAQRPGGVAAPAENIIRTIAGSLLQGEPLYSPDGFREALRILGPELSPALQRISTAIQAAIKPDGTVNADAVRGALNGSISDRYLLDQFERAEYPALIDSELRLTEILRAREGAAQDRELDELFFQQGAAPQAAPTKAPDGASAPSSPEILVLENLVPRSAGDLILADIPEPEPLLEWILYAGNVLVVGGLVKVRKTWFVLQLGLCAVAGIDFLGHGIERKVRVLYIGGEGSDPTALSGSASRLRSGSFRGSKMPTSRTSAWSRHWAG